MTDPRRYVARDCARAIRTGSLHDGAPPGAVFVVIVNETAQGVGFLEIDASVQCGASLTPEGGELIIEVARRLRAAVEQITIEIANERGVGTVRHRDLENELALEDAAERKAKPRPS